MILLLLACDPGPFLVHDGWIGVGSDPWGGGPACDEIYLVDEQLELSTDSCPWATIEQPLQRNVRAGLLLGAVSWDLLYNDQPTQAVIGVAIDGEIAWEHRQPIPNGAGAQRIEIEIDALPQGTPIQLHVHNHGTNRYHFESFRRE